MRQQPAPIAYFAFNRPRHTAQSLAALAANPEAAATDLHAFVDGPRDEDDRAVIDEVVSVIRQQQGFRSLTLSCADRNQGLFRALTHGVGEVVRGDGRVIVVEDDIVVSPHFLRYMNDALACYEHNPAVGSIHGYSPPLRDLPEYFFLQGGDCWGWATWADRWALFVPDAEVVLSRVAGQLPAFASSHGWQSIIQLVRRAQHRNQSWAILWHASLFLAHCHTLHPGQSFVENIGHDGSGAHSRASEAFTPRLRDAYRAPTLSKVEQDPAAARALSGFLDELAVGRPLGAIGRLALSWYARLLVRLQA